MKARDFFELTVYEEKNGKALIGDGFERFWINAKGLLDEYEESKADEKTALYDKWCLAYIEIDKKTQTNFWSWSDELEIKCKTFNVDIGQLRWYELKYFYDTGTSVIDACKAIILTEINKLA
jgi:hypothetical protein